MLKDQATGLEALFQHYYSDLCRFAFSKLRKQEESEDVVQEVFVKLWQKRHSLQPSTSLKAYLLTATRNACFNLIEKKKREKNLHQGYQENQVATKAEAGGPTPEEIQSRIMEALDELPPKCRQVFELSRFEGMTYQEIADHLDISPKTVENQMGKALSILRKALAPLRK